MRVLAFKPGHDASAVCIDDGRLVFSFEAEKDSFPRFSGLSTEVVAQAIEAMPGTPDIVAIGGWHKDLPRPFSDYAAGYFGHESFHMRDGHVFGKPTKVFTSSHERSHIFMATGMAPLAPLAECVVLVWEGLIGAFYHWQEYGARIRRVEVLKQPGAKYTALFALCNPLFPDRGAEPENEYAGKLMALAAYGDVTRLQAGDRAVVESLLACASVYPFDKAQYRGTALYNCGIHVPRMDAAARYMTDRVFQIFFDAARQSLPRGLPLVISGGCGLNCEWNRRWQDCGMFSSVFVPPCTNDSGSAIGTALDALVQCGQPCRVEWSVYSGAAFHHDRHPDSARWTRQPVDLDEIALRLSQGKVFAWVQGDCEIGPRALGHRSLLASPLTLDTRDVLNAIKQREDYRPIAPVCIREDLHELFDPAIDDPYMLYFSSVKVATLPAVTHADGSARVQAVSAESEPILYRLLTAFKAATGYGVLCNTSLNFKGAGFINRTSDLEAYCEAQQIGDFVVDQDWYSHK